MKKHINQVKPHDIGVKKNVVNLCVRLLQRLQGTQRSTMAFYFFGLVILVMFDLQSTFFILKSSAVLWILIIPVTLTIIASIMLVAQQISADSGSDMVRRPLWFIFVMLLATATAYGVIWYYDRLIVRLFGGGIMVALQFRYVLFFAPLSWLSCLYLQRAEDEAQFATLSIRRSMLNRDIAQSQLLAARSQINPLLVVRILNEIQALYEIDAVQASALMDHLIAYLRLAMNRLREKNPLFVTEVTLIRSYFALREAEIKVKIDLEMAFSGKRTSQRNISPVPLFLIAQKMFDTAVIEGGMSLKMRIDVLENSMKISLGVGTAVISNNRLTGLNADLREIFNFSGDILQYIAATEEHCYAIEFQTE